MNKLEKELKRIWAELEALDKEEHSWLHIEELYNKFEEKYLNTKREEITEDIEIDRIMVFGEIFQVAHSFTKELQNGEEMPPFQGRELDFIQKIADKAPQMLEELRKKTHLDKRIKIFLLKKGRN